MRFASLAPIIAISLAEAGCGGMSDPREAEIASVLANANQSYIRSRPALVAGEYELMASDAFSYLRGSLPLYLADWQNGDFGLAKTAYEVDVLPVVLGDAHPENFGVLRARDGSFALEPNDFDCADRAPYLWDVKRLAVGMNLAARLSNGGDPTANAAAVAAARSISYAVGEGYATAMASYAAGAPRARVFDDGSPVLADLFKRSAEDTQSRAELADETVLTNGVRKLTRGAPDPTTPSNVFADLPPDAVAALPATLEAYRQTLVDPPPSSYFALKDAVRELGAGVASWPKVRCILLIEGPTTSPDDDVMLELKEVGDSDILTTAPVRVYYDDDAQRVIRTTRTAWAIPDADPLWSASDWLGFVVQVRTETEGEKGVKVSRLTGSRGTPEAITALATTLGALLARIHASPPGDGTDPKAAIAAVIAADPAGFAEEQAAIGDAYGQRVLADWPLFADALQQLGPDLGFPVDPDDAPSPDLTALYGTPPAAAP